MLSMLEPEQAVQQIVQVTGDHIRYGADVTSL